MKYKISVAMAVFEGERFIQQQLESILSQSLIPDEIIICDDSGNDKTYKAIENIIKQHPGVTKYFKNDTRLGVSKNFEKAVSLTSGDLIFLADQDDVWKQDKIAELTALIDTSPGCGGAFCNSELVDENLNPLGITHWELRGFKTDELRLYPPEKMLDIFLRRVPAAGHNMAFRSKFKDLLLPFPELSECHDTWIGLVIAATDGWVFTSNILTLFRQHADNVSQAGRSGQLKAALEAIKNASSAWNTALYNELTARLAPAAIPEILELLEDRRDHSAARAQMDCNIFKRLPLIIGEIKNKRYFKYGRGWKNVIQDILLRGISG